MTPKTQQLIFNKIKPICYVIYDIDIELRPRMKYLLIKNFKVNNLIFINLFKI